VPPNEFNSLALQLSEKEKILTARETALAIREEALAPENQALTIIVLYGAIAIILLLLFLNFYLDWRRASRPSDLPHENNRVIHLS
jgi:hypothetical protein